jgi:hypothetical protein
VKADATPERRHPLCDDSPTGLLRLFRADHASQAGWLLPLALAAVPIATRRHRALPPGQRNAVAL